MSEVVTAPGAMDFNDKPSFIKGKGIFTLGGLVGGLGLWGYLAFGSGTTHEYALNSYIYGYIFWLMVTLGCLGLRLLRFEFLKLVRAGRCLRRCSSSSSPSSCTCMWFMSGRIRLTWISCLRRKLPTLTRHFSRFDWLHTSSFLVV